jgi:hypothetical protein
MYELVLGTAILAALTSSPAIADVAPAIQPLYVFAGGASGSGGADGGGLLGGVISDAAGNRYGATLVGGTAPGRAGTVFKLSPPASGSGPWTKSILYSFANIKDGRNPNSTLLIDGAGNLYGTTVGGGANGTASYGTVFELSPSPNGIVDGWSMRTLP